VSEDHEHDHGHVEDGPSFIGGTATAQDAGYDHDDGPAPRRHRSIASCLVVLLVMLAIGGAAAFGVVAGIDRLQGMFSGPEDYSGEGQGSVIFEVQQGDSVSRIGANLAAEDVVASTGAFTEAAAGNPDANTIQVGFYELRREMSASAALDVLIDPSNLVQSQVTIPEGLRVPEALERLAEATNIPLRDFRAAVKRDRAIGLPDYADGNPEGYLFPATYAVPPNAEAVDVLSMMVQRWRQAADEVDLEGAAEELGYSPGELMTIASLVESEVNRAEDRGKVARVIYNRLETDATDGKLQIDATVNYALGRDLGLALTQEDLDVDSPYNTRKFAGLPPGPIESPGDAALEATVNPEDGDWVYYVTVNLDTGETKFTEDYDEFLRFKNQELAEFCEGSDRC
jgi:UPF0755 protein